MKPKQLKFPFTWEERRPMISDGVLFIPDYYDRHDEYQFPGWEPIFGNKKPVVVEYCSGNGTWIAEKAKDSEKNWVAVEYDFERVRKIWSKKKNYGLDNLFIISGEALTFAREYLPPHSIAEVFINFPDPWPKEKHAKNRLFQQPFIEQLARTTEGTVTAVTDDPVYSEQIVREMATHWEMVLSTNTWENYGASYFDTLWREKGKEIRYFQFKKRKLPSKGILVPQDEKISGLERFRDSYRLIPELQLNQMWDGLDELYIFENHLCPQGRRHVQGFIAAGGKTFGAEGFEPPTHCSQSSCASQTALCSERLKS
jgi:tRNA (guanine-N7-)-methyltransferase